MAKLNISPFLDSSVVLPKGLYLSCPQHLTPKARREKWVSHTEGSQTSFILYWETEDCIAGSGMKKGNVSQLQPWDRHLKNLKCKEGKKKVFILNWDLSWSLCFWRNISFQLFHFVLKHIFLHLLIIQTCCCLKKNSYHVFIVSIYICQTLACFTIIIYEWIYPLFLFSNLWGMFD